MEMEVVVHCVALALFVFTGAACVLCHEGGEDDERGGLTEVDERSTF